MKNYLKKLLIILFLTLCATIMPTYAKELTLKQLGEEIEKIDAKTGVESSYAYIIGEYVYTSNAKHFGTQDVMLAAQTIKLTADDGYTDQDKIFGKMSIQKIERVYNGFKAIGWRYSGNVLGNTTIDFSSDKTINVKYIDYNDLSQNQTVEPKIVDTDKLLEEAMTKIDSKLFSMDNTDNGVVKVMVNDLKQPIINGIGSNILPIILDLVAREEIESIDFYYNDDVKYTITKDVNLSEIYNWFETNSEAIFQKNSSDIITADLIGKEFTATINLTQNNDNLYLSKNSNSSKETYIIKFDGKLESINTDDIISNALESIDGPIFEKNEFKDGAIDITVKDIKQEFSTAVNSELLKFLTSLVGNDDVESIDFIYNSSIKYTFTKDVDVNQVLAWFEVNSKTMFNLDYDKILTADLIDKSFKIKINLKDYAEKEELNPKNYTINFVGQLQEVDTDKLINNCLNELNNEYLEISKLTNGTFKVIFSNVETEITPVMLTKLYNTINNLVQNEVIDSVKLSCDNVEYTFTKTSKALDMIVWFLENSKTIFNKDYENENMTLEDLENKLFTINIKLSRYATKDKNSADNYSINTVLKKHKVTFEKNDGSTETIVSMVNDGKKVEKPSITRVGYNFEGWYVKDTENINQKFDFNQPITNDVSLEAHWRKILNIDDYILEANVSYNNYKSTYSEENKTVDITITRPQDSISSLNLVKGIKDLVEKDEVAKVTISYGNQDYNFTNDNKLSDNIEQFMNNLLQTSNYKDVENTLKQLDDKNLLIKVEFDSNKVEQSDIATGLVYQINFKVLKHEVTFKYNDNNTKDEIVEVDNYGRLTEKIPNSRNGYRFDGWYYNNQKFSFNKEITEDMVLTAHWIKTYIVKFDDGTTIDMKVVDANTKVSEPTKPQKQYYKFLGWYEKDSETPFDFSMSVTKDIDLTAHWVEILHGGELESVNKSIEEAKRFINDVQKTEESDYIVLSVDEQKHILNTTFYGYKDTTLQYALTGIGIREALYTFLHNQYVKSVTLSLLNMEPVYVTEEMVQSNLAMQKYALQFLEPFKQATGKEATDIEMQDLPQIAPKIKVKVNLENGKVLEDEREYTINFKLVPTE